jgi:glutamyl-Q tRNA(Asp) synthetase
LQTALGLPHPQYAHVPLVTEPDGRKLAKSRRSLAVDRFEPQSNLHVALTLLGQLPPPELREARVSEILAWATANWRPCQTGALSNRAQIAVDELGLGL